MAEEAERRPTADEQLAEVERFQHEAQRSVVKFLEAVQAYLRDCRRRTRKLKRAIRHLERRRSMPQKRKAVKRRSP